MGKLNAQRNHVLGALEDLEEDDLRRPVLPSGWTCLGLVQHLALDVERLWFSCVIAGDEKAIAGLDEDPQDAWAVALETPAAAVTDGYREWIERADAVVAGTALDAPPSWWPEALFGSWRLHSLREVLLHVLTETATHAGHLDAARELIDGRQWLVLTGDS